MIKLEFKSFLCAVVALLCTCVCEAKDFVVRSGQPVCLSVCGATRPVVQTACDMFAGDVRLVLSSDVVMAGPGVKRADIEVRKDSALGWEGFEISVDADGTLVVRGGDDHGMAYGLLEVSRLLGVSPWEWWADVLPEKKSVFVVPESYVTSQRPSVRYRGIFINDEDWGLMPWSSGTLEPGNARGVVGPVTNSRIFELLLRLRANYYWPAMHECTVPFFLTEGNREVAEKYGIYIGGSHCEPMASSTAGEWRRRGKGEYDYVNNAGNVRSFWAERLAEVGSQEILYTVGMRGVHDGKMNGASTVAEQKEVLGRVISDQRDLLRQYVDRDVTRVPQVFIPYKEVLDVYKDGLDVPEDITLMWCDDNYGYVTHFPDSAERLRPGGNGIYYHVSYWGRPFDYLWLGTFSPYLLYHQMSKAYDYGIRQIWVLNVGDLKPAEYQIELFLDMAWSLPDVRSLGVEGHMRRFYGREFGDENSAELASIMSEHYRLAYVRKPEFMAGTRTEEADRVLWDKWHEQPWTDRYVDGRLADYASLAKRARAVAGFIPEERRSAYLQLVEYPVLCSNYMNRKVLVAQKARHTSSEADSLWRESDAAYDSIVDMTALYNRGYDGRGKWNGIMDMRPRRLSAFDKAPRECVSYEGDRELQTGDDCLVLNAAEPTAGRLTPVPGLGYEGGAAELEKGGQVKYKFRLKDFTASRKDLSDSVVVELRFVPTHPVDGSRLAVDVAFDDVPVGTLAYQTQGRSEEWKRNVLRSQTVRRITVPLSCARSHTLSLKAQTLGVVLDQIVVRKR